MIVAILIFVTTISSSIDAESLASTLTSEDKIKSCMSIIFTRQSGHLQEHQTYTQSLDDLSLANSPDCQGMDIKIDKADKKFFVIEVTNGIQSWIIDSNKTMLKIN